MKRRSGAVLLCLLLAACAGLPYEQMAPPEVLLSDVRLAKVRLLEQHYRLDLRMRNPNDVDLPLGGISYTLTLNGREFASGVSNDSWLIPAGGEAIVTLKAVSSFGKVLEQFHRLKKSGGAVEYALTGEIGLGRHGPKLPFETRDRIRLDD